MSIRGRSSLIVVALFALGNPSSSEAKLILITRGAAISDLGKTKGLGGDLPRELSSVGYRYKYVGAFWVDLWRYDGSYCVYDGNKTYLDLTQAQAALLLGKSEAELNEPFFYHCPPGLLILGIVIVAACVAALIKKKKDRDIEQLINDPRYQLALALYLEKSQPPKMEDNEEPTAVVEPTPEVRAAAWDAAIDQLTDSGIEREKAERNLQKVLLHVTRSAQ